VIAPVALLDHDNFCNRLRSQVPLKLGAKEVGISEYWVTVDDDMVGTIGGIVDGEEPMCTFEHIQKLIMARYQDGISLHEAFPDDKMASDRVLRSLLALLALIAPEKALAAQEIAHVQCMKRTVFAGSGRQPESLEEIKAVTKETSKETLLLERWAALHRILHEAEVGGVVDPGQTQIRLVVWRKPKPPETRATRVVSLLKDDNSDGDCSGWEEERAVVEKLQASTTSSRRRTASPSSSSSVPKKAKLADDDSLDKDDKYGKEKDDKGGKKEKKDKDDKKEKKDKADKKEKKDKEKKDKLSMLHKKDKELFASVSMEEDVPADQMRRARLARFEPQMRNDAADSDAEYGNAAAAKGQRLPTPPQL